MAADFTRILKRVSEILNVCDAGTYSAVVSTRNKTRNAVAISDGCYEAGIKVLQATAETPNEFRGGLISTVTVAHGDILPEHLGKPAFVEIQRYLGAIWRKAKHKPARAIESYRENIAGAYDEIPHAEEGSTLSGYYNIWENKFYYTGYAARVGLAQAVRADVLTKIPDFFESVVVKLAVGNCLKLGENAATMQMAQWYAVRGESDLAAFSNGRRVFTEVSETEPVTEIHQ